MHNERAEQGGTVAFNPTLLIAAAVDLHASVTPIADAVASVLHSLVRVRCIRQWGYRFGEASFSSAIGDLAVTGLFKPGPRHQKAPAPEMFAGTWEAF